MGHDSPDVMFDEDVTCDDCHGSGGDIARPEPAVCVDCHDDEYEEMPAEWKSDVATLAAEVQALLNAAENDQARKLLTDIEHGAAGGIHNYDLTLELLADFRNALRRDAAAGTD